MNNASEREPPDKDKVAPTPTNEATNHALEISKQKEDRSLYKGVSCVINFYSMRFSAFVNAQSCCVDSHLCTRIFYISPRIFPIMKSIFNFGLKFDFTRVGMSDM